MQMSLSLIQTDSLRRGGGGRGGVKDEVDEPIRSDKWDRRRI